MAKADKYVYSFGPNGTDGDASMRALLGGKGANLAAMTRIGLPVPPGFTITTEVCTHFYQNGKKFPATLPSDLTKAIAWLEKETGKKFGDPKNPLLVSNPKIYRSTSFLKTNISPSSTSPPEWSCIPVPGSRREHWQMRSLITFNRRDVETRRDF